LDRSSFFDNLVKLSDAPNGVAKLRRLILQLAVQGRLVGQNKKDEPATELLKRIHQERHRRLQQNGKSTQRPLPPINANELPFTLPSGWSWERLGNIGDTNVGLTYSPKDIGKTGTPVLRSNNIQNGKLDLSNLVRVDVDPPATVLVEVGDLLVCARNGSKALVGKAALIEQLTERTAFGAFMAIFRSSINEYLYYFIASPLFRKMIDDVNTTTINQITQANLRATIAPIPPFDEQKRIVAKVRELMRFCDDLEVQQQAQREGRVRLNKTVLAPLNKAASLTPEEFEQATRRLVDNFDTLYDSIDTVSKLRSTILQLAVQGKLVPQDPDDEAAAILLSKNREQTKSLTNNESSQSKVDDGPFVVPAGWKWTPLTEMGVFLGGGTPSKSNPAFWQGCIPWISPKDMKKLYVADAKDHISEHAVQETSVRKIPVGSLLMVVRGMILAHSFPVALTEAEVTINQDMKALVFQQPEISEYVLLACRGLKNLMLSKVARSSHGTCRLETSEIESFLIPLPPLQEQKRIVAKVNQLMSLCDELEAKLRQAEADGEKLMNAAVKHVLDCVRDTSKTTEEVFA
jgi:type I restriction enzyme, S subunit